MRTLSRLWTGAVAYVSLLVGAGLSMAGNLADTYRTRGHDVDGLDKILAISWPALVILAIEMFVSPRWNKSTVFQVWRWTGCLAIGGMAMLASWTHLHDLLASRGQLATVAMLGPLAIDGMAIMATGLILSTRGQVGQVGQADVATDLNNGIASGQTEDPVLDVLATQPDDPTVDIKAELARWAEGYELAIGDLGQELASETEAYVHGQATTKTRTVPVAENVPAEAADLIARMRDQGARPGEIDQAVAEMMSCSTRNARRWRGIVTKQPEGR